MKHQTEIEAQYAWQRKGKKYKTKYFEALRELFGDDKYDKESQLKARAYGRYGASQISCLADKK